MGKRTDDTYYIELFCQKFNGIVENMFHNMIESIRRKIGENLCDCSEYVPKVRKVYLHLLFNETIADDLECSPSEHHIVEQSGFPYATVVTHTENNNDPRHCFRIILKYPHNFPLFTNF